MSTRSTIIHGERFHLYEDYDDMEIYLEMENVQFSADVLEGRSIIRVQIPEDVYLALGLPTEIKGYGTLLCLRADKWQQKNENIKANLDALMQRSGEKPSGRKGVQKKRK